MKKILISILILFSAGLFAEEISHEEEFTWAKYEMMCYMNGVEPSYEEYSFLLEVIISIASNKFSAID